MAPSFDALDVNGDGVITREEFEKGMRQKQLEESHREQEPRGPSPVATPSWVNDREKEKEARKARKRQESGIDKYSNFRLGGSATRDVSWMNNIKTQYENIASNKGSHEAVMASSRGGSSSGGSHTNSVRSRSP